MALRVEEGAAVGTMPQWLRPQGLWLPRPLRLLQRVGSRRTPTRPRTLRIKGGVGAAGAVGAGQRLRIRTASPGSCDVEPAFPLFFSDSVVSLAVRCPLHHHPSISLKSIPPTRIHPCAAVALQFSWTVSNPTNGNFNPSLVMCARSSGSAQKGQKVERKCSIHSYDPAFSTTRVARCAPPMPHNPPPPPHPLRLYCTCHTCTTARSADIYVPCLCLGAACPSQRVGWTLLWHN